VVDASRTGTVESVPLVALMYCTPLAPASTPTIMGAVNVIVSASMTRCMGAKLGTSPESLVRYTASSLAPISP
jgi:hypothetical protein